MVHLRSILRQRYSTVKISSLLSNWPIAVHMKETYENLQDVLQKIHYEEHQRNVCADLKL